MRYLDFIKNEKLRNTLKYIILFLFNSILVLIVIYLIFNNFIVASVVEEMLTSMGVISYGNIK